MVADGSGRELFESDVAVADGRIVAIGPGLDPSAADVVLDARSRVVAPGFIDLHSHYDAQVFWDPTLASSCHQGVTTVVNGNCGFSLAPMTDGGRETVLSMLRDLEDMRLDTLAAGVPESLPTFSAFLAGVERQHPYLNFAAFVGHSTVRIATMGTDAFERKATGDEIDAMRSLVDDALAAGAAGFATKTLPGSRPSPSQFAAAAETEALLDVLGKRGSGIAMFNPGGVFDHERVYAAQAATGRPFTWIALMAMPDGRHHAWAELHRRWWAAGADVHPQVSCRPLLAQCTFHSPYLFRAASISELFGVPLDERVAAYRSQGWRRRLADQLAAEQTIKLDWYRLVISESPTRPDLVGSDVGGLARAAGASALDFIFDLALDDGCDTRVTLAYGNDVDSEVTPLLHMDGTVLGLSDAGAHPDQLCDAILPTDLLGGWVRDRGAIGLEAAVRKLTAEAADLLGLADRGRIAAGARADIVVFDPETVAPGPIRRVNDFPADADHLVADAPVGIDHILVNGVVTRREGTAVTLPCGPGMVLRSFG
jgi:N-acyl-D-aspartate/D-glutamate deacylase